MNVRMLLLLIFLLAACAPLSTGTVPPDTAVTSPPEGSAPPANPSPGPSVPLPDDGQQSREPVYIDEASLLIRESFPPQISLSIRGSLPTPCHHLRTEIAAPDQDNKIAVDVYSVVASDQICIQVLEPFDEQIELGTFPGGHYSVWVNGQLAGEFDS